VVRHISHHLVFDRPLGCFPTGAVNHDLLRQPFLAHSGHVTELG